MCNRIRSIKDWSQIPRELYGELFNFEFNPNVAPTEPTVTFLGGIAEEPVARLARFGIARPPKDGTKRPPLLNVRTDTLRKGAFSSLLNSKRCVIPADGFYEWKDISGLKKPFFFYRNDDRPIMLAGIWDISEVKGDQVASFAILTDEPNELIAPYHDRMPVILNDPMSWLRDNSDPLDTMDVLSLSKFAVRPVNSAVNRVAEKDIARIERPDDIPSQASLF